MLLLVSRRSEGSVLGSCEQQLQGGFRTASGQFQRQGVEGHLSLFFLRSNTAPLLALQVLLGALGGTALYSSYRMHVPCRAQARGLYTHHMVRCMQHAMCRVPGV